MALQYGITSVPRLDDPNFVSRVVFDQSKPAGTPKERFGYLFPNKDAAQIIVRLRPDMTDAERHEAIGLFRQAVSNPRFKLSDGSYIVTGAPVVVDAGARELRNQTLLLLGRRRPGDGADAALHPAAAAAAAAPGGRGCGGAMTIGLVALFGGSLTVGAIAMLPVLVGLAVDYAIQFQARFNEARAEGAPPRPGGRGRRRGGGPVIGAACVATIAGFAVFALSPSPLVRSLRAPPRGRGRARLPGGAHRRVRGARPLAWRGTTPVPSTRGPAGAGAAGARLRSIGVGAIALAIARPRRVLAAGRCSPSAAGSPAPGLGW